MVYTTFRYKQRCIILAPNLEETRKAVANPPSYETREDRLFRQIGQKSANPSGKSMYGTECGLSDSKGIALLAGCPP